MKIKILKDNRRIIAEGHYKGKKIKAISTCDSDDSFDETFGIKLAKLKYSVKLNYAKMNMHESYIKELKQLISWANQSLKYENNIAEELDVKIQKQIIDCKQFVNTKYHK